jgi:hypothetical protein
VRVASTRVASLARTFRRPRLTDAGRSATSFVRRGDRDDRAQPELLLADERSVERLADLFLEASLLVQADLEIREHAQLRMGLGVALGPLALVVREGIAQVALTVGRVARPETVEETLEGTPRSR